MQVVHKRIFNLSAVVGSVGAMVLLLLLLLGQSQVATAVSPSHNTAASAAIDDSGIRAALSTTTTIATFDFESTGGYTLTDSADGDAVLAEVTNGFEDFYTRSDGSNIGSDVEYTGQQGDYYFAVMDSNGSSGVTDQLRQTFDTIDIEGVTNLQLSVLVAEDDDGSNQDWDGDTSVTFEYSIDGGAYSKVLAFEAVGGTNTEPAQDTNFDGTGDGITVTNVFTTFTGSIAETGITLTLRVNYDFLEAGDEDIAIDNIVISGLSDAGVALPVSEGFDSCSPAPAGWTIFSVDTDTSNTWACSSSYAEVNAFGATAAADDWLISPPIDFDASSGEQMSFRSYTRFADSGQPHPQIDVLYSTNYSGTGDPSTSTWTPIAGFTFSPEDSQAWTDSGTVDISSISGDKVYIAFQHQSSGTGAGSTSRWRIDDVLIEELAPEPTNHTTMFTATATSDTVIDTTWTDSVAGAQAPAGYLVMCSTTNSFTDPIDGTAQSDDNCGDGTGVQSAASGTEMASWGGLTASTQYYFKIYPYTNGGANIDYKTDGTVPTATATTAAPIVKACDTATANTCIHEIQGTVDESPLDGTSVTVEGIVVGSYEGLSGFFMQEEDADIDSDDNTSEGIFVFTGSAPTVVEGDKVQVTGAVDNFFNHTQLDNDNSDLNVVLVSSGNALPTPASVSLPASGPTDDSGTFEAYESMLVTFPDELTVSEYFELARYGQVILMQGGRQYQFTHNNLPDAAGYTAHQADVATRRIILDDTNNVENGSDNVFHPQPDGFSATSSFRGGDTVTDMIGVMHWSWAGVFGTNAWRIRPTTSNTVTFTSANPRPETPDSVGGNVTVATLNVLNYFTTLDTGSSTCGPSNIGCRGANTEAELIRQTSKLTRTLLAIDADVVGLVELENNATESLQAIIDGLNAELGSDVYAFVNTGAITSTTGGDAIKVGFIYKTTTMSLNGSHAILNTVDFTDPNSTGSDKNRPAVAQTFTHTGSGESFTAVVNHFKSKGSGCGAGDDDTTKGQGNCNGTRTGAAEALVDWLATDPTNSGDDDILILGDLNAYAMEDPIMAVKAGADDTANTADDFTDLINHFLGSETYSFVFSGEWGYLDHVLANDSLTSQVTGVTEWHINADEPSLLDYNDKILDPGEASFEQKPGTNTYFADDVFRNSDHDPVIIGLSLGQRIYLPLVYTSGE